MKSSASANTIKYNTKKGNYFQRLFNDIKVNPGLYLMSIPTFILIIVFCYFPMYGIILAFKYYDSSLGILNSPNVGFENFQRFFSSYYFSQYIGNTLIISLVSLAVGFPLPIILALMLNSIRNGRFKKIFQMTSYIPNFISTVVIVAMVISFLNPASGIVNTFLRWFGKDPVNFMTEPSYFVAIFVISGVWQSMGWGTIIYTSALSGVDTQLYDAAKIDGANKLQVVLHIDLPTILPTVVVCLILAVGGIMSVGFEKVYLMQNPLNIEASQVISTYTYQVGLIDADYGFGTAVGLFNSIINFILLVIVNITARKATGHSIW
ncbi:MAG: ABC transporter permease subunit [Bacillales bacterium]|nr:ABC transporter permease subunit [Bacillales bacterium]